MLAIALFYKTKVNPILYLSLTDKMNKTEVELNINKISLKQHDVSSTYNPWCSNKMVNRKYNNITEKRPLENMKKMEVH